MTRRPRTRRKPTTDLPRRSRPIRRRLQKVPRRDLQGPQRGRDSRPQEIQSDPQPAAEAGRVDAVKAMASDPNAAGRPDGDPAGGRWHGGPVDRHQEHPGPDRSSSRPCRRLAGHQGHPGSDARPARARSMSARDAKSTRFQTEYNRILVQKLQPLLKHHLVPRVQAMIVLGQSGNPDALKLYLDEIKNTEQTRLGEALGLPGNHRISSRIQPNRLSRRAGDRGGPDDRRSARQEQAMALAGAVAGDRGAGEPAPGLRAVRSQGGRDGRDGHADSRRSQGQDRGSCRGGQGAGHDADHPAVPNYNFGLVAYAAGQLAAQLGDQIAANYSPTRAPPSTRSRPSTWQVCCWARFTRRSRGGRECGKAASCTPTRVRRGPTLRKCSTRSSPWPGRRWICSGPRPGQLKARRQDLTARVAALKEFLAKNAPTNNHLVPQDDGFPVRRGEPAGSARAEPAAAKVAGARRWQVIMLSAEPAATPPFSSPNCGITRRSMPSWSAA